MQYLFIAFTALAVVAFAPLTVTLSLVAIIGIVSLVVRITAMRIIGPVSVIDAVRSAGWAFSLLMAGALCVLWVGQGQVKLEGVAALFLILGLFSAFILGFKIALQASFVASAAIAAVSTAVSGVILFALRPVLF